LDGWLGYLLPPGSWRGIPRDQRRLRRLRRWWWRRWRLWRLLL
jgi:hypothetical protein